MASHHFVFNAWVSFASALLLMVASGTVYLFPVYSTDLADALSLTQAQINTVGTFMNAGTGAAGCTQCGVQCGVRCARH